ncbi:MAG: hypothetical protein IID15_04995, partial [Candidatus Marinimicrobia bacterium]|nr:hypothetical protein [Candidatus Neomarinimicrobiota bacterium]
MIIETTRTHTIEENRRTVKAVRIGAGTRLGHFINLYGCVIGVDCEIGQFVEITKGVTIGDRCRIESLSFICDGVTIGNDCTIGPQVDGGICMDSGCIHTCAQNYGDCTAEAGCETDLLLANNCGACTNDCMAQSNVSAATCLPEGGSAVCEVTECA